MINIENRKWAGEVLEKIISKMEVVSERSKNKIPYSTVDGIHDDWSGEDRIGWWTNGFWGGIMWQLFSMTGKKKYKNIAIDNEKKLDTLFLDYKKLDHDNGFKWLPTAVADYKITGSLKSKNRGILAADNLAGRFNPRGLFIRAWNDWEGSNEDRRGWAIIDCMMNLPLLYWASEETRDPRYKYVAQMHADKAMANFIREDGSVCHIVEFDVDCGLMKKSYGGQGLKEGSSWTRGQAWGIYGFILSYQHTGNMDYLNASIKIADYYINHIPESGKIPVDFLQSEDITWEDSTASAIAACGFIEIAKELKNEKSQKYMDAAIRLLKYLDENSIEWNHDADHLLIKCTAAYHDKNHEFPIIYGDYFFIEAIAKLNNKGINIW